VDPLTEFQEDVLADILQSIHLHSTLYCRAQLGAPWGLGVPSRETAVFHIVTGGSCWLTMEGSDKPVLLNEGDLVILPHGHAHTVSDHPETPAEEFEDFGSRHPPERNGIVYAGGQGAVATLVCGEFQLEGYPTNPLYALLPASLRATDQHGLSMSWVRAIVQLVRAEVNRSQPGAETVITRLSEILFIQMVREYVCTADDGRTGWLRALQDPEIGQALALIHHQPQAPWTLESLGNRVGLARSAFAAKFTLLIGMPPMQYITDMRLTKAATLLRTRPATLIEVALAVGYDSEAAFSKAFKRRFGVAPGAYRRGTRPLRAAL